MILLLTTTTYTHTAESQTETTVTSRYGPMPEADVRAKVAGWAGYWRALRYAVREGDGWATGTTAEFSCTASAVEAGAA